MKGKCIYAAMMFWLFLVIPIGFAIIPIPPGGFTEEDFQGRPTLDELNEQVNHGIIAGNAVQERDVAVNRDVNFLPYCGTWQPYITSLQQELETLASIYIDHENGPLTDAGDDFVYFTLDNWRVAAGLNAGGFRRKANMDDEFGYGEMQAGDICGNWCFEDLQKGFAVLKWSARAGYYSSQANFSLPSQPGYIVWGYSVSEYMNNWNSSTWNENSQQEGYCAMAVHGYGDYYTYVINASRKRCKLSAGSLPATIMGTMEIYLIFGPSPNPPYANFVDFDGLGVIPDKLQLMQNVVVDGSPTFTSEYYGNISTELFSMMGGIPPPPPAYDDYGWGCYTIGGPMLLMKWNFIYQ